MDVYNRFGTGIHPPFGNLLHLEAFRPICGRLDVSGLRPGHKSCKRLSLQDETHTLYNDGHAFAGEAPVLTKPHLRTEMKKALSAMPAGAAGAKSRRACQMLVDLDEFRSAGAIMLYMPIPGEIDCMPAILAAWQQAKTVLVPKVGLEQGQMMAVRCDSTDDEMVTGSYGIREPARSEPWPVENIDLIVVPALGYDRKGNRLGRGGGFYDHFLAQQGMRAVTCGLAFAEQVAEEVPTTANDWPVDIIVTDKEVLRFPNDVNGLRQS